MENNTGGSLNPNDLATLSLLRPGYGGPGVYGGYAGAGMYANQSTIQHGQEHINDNVNCEGEKTRINTDGKASEIFSSLEDMKREFSFNRISDRLNENDRRNTDNQFRSELRISDQMAALREKQAQDAAAAALCCCKLESQAANNQGKTEARLAAIEAKIDANKEIGELRAQLQTQQIFATCGCGCAGGVRTCREHHHRG